jgi:MFS transporter, DHA1 family, multidrug resistance protein
VPVVAPSVGAGIVAIAGWRWVFGFCAAYAVVLGVALLRLPESLAREDRMEASRSRILKAAREVVTNRQTLGYTLAQSALFGVLTSYLGSLELIISDVFDLGEQFPLIFGALASVIGIAMLANTRLVGAFGVRRLVHFVLVGYAAAGAALVWVVLAGGGHPAFLPFSMALAVLLVFHGLLIPNMNTIAMDPMGRIAGMASAVTGTISMAVGALFGSIIDQLYDGSATPLAVGFLVFGLVAGLFVVWAERGVMFQPLRA